LLIIEISKCYLCNAGFNSTLRRGCISYHEYLQIGKGRDVSLNSISKFEAKVANGNSEQTISRDIFDMDMKYMPV
jgi:callose synthase